MLTLDGAALPSVTLQERERDVVLPLPSPSLFYYSRDHPVNWLTGLLWAKTNPFFFWISVKLVMFIMAVDECLLPYEGEGDGGGGGDRAA